MSLKSVYFVKLFSIVVLSTVFLASAETVFDHTWVFLSVAAVCIVSIRLLWVSALKDERAMKRQRRARLQPSRACHAVGELQPSLKHAA